MFNIVLYEPEIPQNTGNIARLCAAAGCKLHLIAPLGFSLEDRYLKRAGLDYWPMVEVKIYDSLQELQKKYSGSRYFYVTTRGRQSYFQFDYQPGDFIVFGRETSGLPEELIAANMNACMRIPMVKGSRSLNLANSVAIIVYEGLRKHMFINLC